MRWEALVVYDKEGGSWGPLGELVAESPDLLDGAVLGENGEIMEWQDFFLAAPGEDPDWDTPASEVDWAGFREALEQSRLCSDAEEQ